MTDETIKKIAKGAGIVFIGTGIGMFFAYLASVIVARLLGPSDFGLISLASTVATIASTIVLVGMPEGIVRFIALYKGVNDQGRIKSVIISSLSIVVPLSLVAGLFLFFFSDLISIRIFNKPDLTMILKIFSFSIPFYSIFAIFIYAIGGFQELKYMVYIRDIFQNSVRLFFILILLLLGYGIYGVAIVYTFTIITLPFASLFYLNKIFPVFSKKIKSISMKKELFSYSWPLMFAGILGLVMGWIDTLMLGYLLEAKDVGIYRASMTTASLVLIIPSSFASIFFPVITEFYSRGEKKEFENINAVVTKWILMIVLPLVLLMIIFSKQILYILYGVEYMAGAFVLSILGIAYFITAIFSPTNQLIPVIGRTKLIMINTSIGALLNVLLNFLLIPIYAINGAAIATTISLLVVNALAFLEVRAITNIKPIRLNYLRIFFASIIATIIVYVITILFFKVIPISILFSMFLLYMCSYFSLLLLIKAFEKEDIVIMKAIEERSGMRLQCMRNLIARFF